MARRKRDTEVKLPISYFREWRKFRELNLSDAAEAMGVTESAVSRLERAVTPYDQVHLMQLSKLYRCSIPDLLGRDPLRQKPVDELIDRVRKLTEPEEIKAALGVVNALLAKR